MNFFLILGRIQEVYMVYDLTPSSFWRSPVRFPSFWDDDDELSLNSAASSGVSISEDEKNVYVEAALPGVNPKDVEVTFDKGMVWIKGETKEEEKEKKYYRKAVSSFSYRIAVPGELDPQKEPEAICKNGVMTVSFAKSAIKTPKKIAVKE